MDKGAYPGHSIEKIQLIQVTTEENMPHVRQLFLEYAQWLHGKAAQAHGASFDVVSVTRMFVEESGEFYPPYGRLYLAKYKDDIVGVGCLKRQGRGIGEIKRMYVRPAYRRKGIGKVILDQLIKDARAIGYTRLWLDSPKESTSAHNLFLSSGFQFIEPSSGSEGAQASVGQFVYMELIL